MGGRCGSDCRGHRHWAGPRHYRITTPVADALAYAHRLGILHRDIKPENILFSQGHPVVADFGIAKAISTAGGANLTRTGFPVGTPGYMSPEQAAGLTDLDPRSDVYSLAVVVYEMLVGELPGRWPTEEAVRAGRFLDAPSTHRPRLTDVGSRIEAALVRGLSTRHDQRTATPADLMAELNGSAAPPASRRRYSDGEVKEIVKRAAELEATNPTASGAMTMGGVEALAAEVGIAPGVVRQAEQALRSTPSGAPESPRPNRLIGGPTSLLYERVVEGELLEEDYSALVEEIRSTLNNVGQVSQFGRSFSWIATRRGASQRELEVAVSVRGGRTRITIKESLAPLIGAVYGGIGGGMGGGGMGPIVGILAGAMHIAGPAVAAIVPFWLATTFVTARTVYKRSWAKRNRELERLADRLAAVTGELVPPPRSALRGSV